MIYWVILLIIITFLLQNYLFPKLSNKEKFYLALTIGILIISINIGTYLYSRELNLYEHLNISRTTPKEEILELLKTREDLNQYYEEVKNNIYEFRCLNSTDADWVTKSFTFYGTSLLVINLISFSSTASSRLMLLVVLFTLILEFCLFNKTFTLSWLKFTCCENIEILRAAFPGLAFIAVLLAVVRKDHLIELKKKFTRRLCHADEDFSELEKLVRQEVVLDDIDACDVVRKIIEDNIKEKTPQSNSKKYFKYCFAGYLAYSLLSPMLKII